MRFFTLHRVAAYLLLLFFGGHTAGGMLSNKSFGPQSDTVVAAMRSVHFQAQGADATWYGFWFGLGLDVSVFLLFSAVLAWYLGGVRPEERGPLRPVGWMLFVAQVPVALLSWRYFFVGPGVFSTVIAALLGAACLRWRAAG
jgi:hypothetical protein